MAKTYIEDVKLTAARNKIFTSLAEREQISIFDALTLSSGDYLPTQKMMKGDCHVYGGGGIIDKTHNDFNVEFETLGIGRVGARCGCVFRIKSKSWITDNALYASKISKDYEIDFLIHYLDFKNINQLANTSAQPVISQKRISVISIPKIDLKFQREIIRILNDVEKGIININGDKFGIKQILKFVETEENLNSELTHQLSLVQQLRRQLLQEAVQGKLLAQNPADEPADALLRKIKAEKEQLIKAGKLKKGKDLPPINAEEVPFEVPEGWVWCRLGEVIHYTEGGKSPNCINEPAKGENWGVIKTTAVQEIIFLENENKVLPKNFSFNEQHKVREGDILITRAGPKNRVGVVCYVENLTKKLILSDKTIRIEHSKVLLSPKFLTFVLNSPLIKPIIETKMVGMADSQVNISQENMKGFPIPLPPLPEQHRIVQKLEQLLQTCDALEAGIRHSQELNAQLLQQVLREALAPAPSASGAIE